jgi:hypothetical protein
MAKAKPSSPATEASAPELPRIHTVRKQKVMLDSELAALFGVETKVFNQAIRRNLNKFPSDFAFCLTRDELANLRSQIVTSSSSKDAALRSQPVTLKDHGGLRYLPWVFTEHGALMAAMILRSERAASVSVFVVRAFVQMREQIGANLGVLRRLAEIDKKTPRTRRRPPRGRRTPRATPQSSARGRPQETQNRLPPGQPLTRPTHSLRILNSDF